MSQGPIQHEHLQGWGIHGFCGQYVPAFTVLWLKNFLLTSNRHLPSFNLNNSPLSYHYWTMWKVSLAPDFKFPVPIRRSQQDLPRAFSSPGLNTRSLGNITSWLQKPPLVASGESFCEKTSFELQVIHARLPSDSLGWLPESLRADENVLK